MVDDLQMFSHSNNTSSGRESSSRDTGGGGGGGGGGNNRRRGGGGGRNKGRQRNSNRQRREEEEYDEPKSVRFSFVFSWILCVLRSSFLWRFGDSQHCRETREGVFSIFRTLFRILRCKVPTQGVPSFLQNSVSPRSRAMAEVLLFKFKFSFALWRQSTASCELCDGPPPSTSMWYRELPKHSLAQEQRETPPSIGGIGRSICWLVVPLTPHNHLVRT